MNLISLNSHFIAFIFVQVAEFRSDNQLLADRLYQSPSDKQTRTVQPTLPSTQPQLASNSHLRHLHFPLNHRQVVVVNQCVQLRNALVKQLVFHVPHTAILKKCVLILQGRLESSRQ